MSGVRAALAMGTARLGAAGIESARLDARVLLAKVTGVGSGEVLTLSRGLTAAEDAFYETMLARRVLREPLAYITGSKEFWSLDFEVGPGVLIPRPDTETLIEETLKEFPDRTARLRILDLGTGSGCLLVTALTLYPNATGTGIDRSEAALAWARRNSLRFDVSSRCTLRCGDWTAVSGGQFDLVLTNPPYLATTEMGALGPELSHEPPEALESGPEGIEAYRSLGPAISAILAPEGRVVLEVGAGQSQAVSAALEVENLEILRIAPDLSGIPRAVVARAGRGDVSKVPQKTVGKPETSR